MENTGNQSENNRKTIETHSENNWSTLVKPLKSKCRPLGKQLEANWNTFREKTIGKHFETNWKTIETRLEHDWNAIET